MNNWQLCDGSSECLVDLWGNGNASWQAARSYFRKKGYYGNFLLIHRTATGFRTYYVNL